MELENAFAGDYMEPDGFKKPQPSRAPRLSDVSIDDLKAVMREELHRFRSTTSFKSTSSESEVFEDGTAALGEIIWIGGRQ